MKRRLLETLKPAFFLAVLLTAFMFIGLISGQNNAYATTETATVTVSAQTGNTFLAVPQAITVEAGYAKKIGGSTFANDPANVGDHVSALDVLFAINEKLYGTDFTSNVSDYITGGGGYINKAFGLTDFMSFSVNDLCPNDGVIGGYGTYTGYLINQTKVGSGDDLNFFFYQDGTYYMDQLCWFEQNGAKVTEVNGVEGKDISLTLKGYTYMYFGCNADVEDHFAPIEDAQLTTVDGDGITIGNELDSAVTDEDGKVTLNFDKPGTYYVSAYTDMEYSSPIVSPYIKVVVAKSLETIKAEAIAETEGYKDATKYTEDEQAEIAEILAQGKEDINGATSEEEINQLVADIKAKLDKVGKTTEDSKKDPSVDDQKKDPATDDQKKDPVVDNDTQDKTNQDKDSHSDKADTIQSTEDTGVQTGDTQNPLMWIGILGATVFILGGVWILKKK